MKGTALCCLGDRKVVDVKPEVVVPGSGRGATEKEEGRGGEGRGGKGREGRGGEGRGGKRREGGEGRGGEGGEWRRL